MKNFAPDFNNRRFPIYGVGSPEFREAQMSACLEHGFPPLERGEPKAGRMTIVCYGPSLLETWTQIRRPIMTVSGAHDFLTRGGMTPDYHVECDPREHKATFTRNPNKETEYLMASVCHPSIWQQLNGYNVKIWHSLESKQTNDWVKRHDPDGIVISGGSNVGIRAIEVAGTLGYTKFDIHGMDFSFKNGRHAGPHPNETEREILVKLGGREYRTSKQLYEGAREIVQIVCAYDCEWKFYGDGLLQAMLNEVKTLRRRSDANQRRPSLVSG